MARLLGAKSYGYFVYATSWMAILLLGCNIGLKPTVVRFVAAYNARSEWGSLRGLLRRSTRWTIAASAAVTILSAIALWLLRPRFDELGTTLAVVASAMPFMALTNVWSSAVRGLGAVARSQFPASIVQHVLVGIALVIIVVCRWRKWRGCLGGRSFSFRNHRRDGGGAIFSATRTAPASADIVAQLLSR